MDPTGRWDEQYRDSVKPQIVAVMVAAQIAATREADLYVSEVLNELAFGPLTEAGVVRPRSLAGWAGDGRPVSSLMDGAVVHASKSLQRARERPLAEGATTTAPTTLPDAEEALADAEAWVDMVAQTIIADAARAAESVAMAQRPWLDGWVRMINPPCCSRCALLSGKFYLFTDGFLRHPRCDCFHIPAPKDPDKVRDLIAINSPERYFESLTKAEQNRIFTNAGAEAIRSGADIDRVINARRGMETTGESETQQRMIDGEEFTVNVRRRQIATRQVYGRDVFVTKEATTKRGRLPGQIRGVRLMPESILQLAGDDPDERARLLRLHGYIT
jgi:hypothetical protein